MLSGLFFENYEIMLVMTNYAENYANKIYQSLIGTRGPFLESPDTLMARRAVYRGFKIFADNMINPSVGNVKCTGLYSLYHSNFGPERLPGRSGKPAPGAHNRLL